ncbi:MAG: translation elongation factor Ts [Sphaerochaetaceae bacterium]
MEITAAQVKQLRDATGSGMMDCKRALVQANGDFAAADKILKEMGLAAVAKRQDRATDNGRVFVKANEKTVVMLEVSCETDFVAANAKFVELGEKLCSTVLDKGYTEINDELNDMVKSLIAVIKENMSLKKLLVLPIVEGHFVSTYLHGPGAMGVVVEFATDKIEIANNPIVKEFANDCALHVAAFTPSYLEVKSVPQSYIDEQLSIFKVQVKDLQKPEKVLEGIVRGKLNKHLGEICFLNQAFVKDETMNVEKKMTEVAKEVGAKLSIVSFHYFVAGVNA